MVVAVHRARAAKAAVAPKTAGGLAARTKKRF